MDQRLAPHNFIYMRFTPVSAASFSQTCNILFLKFYNFESS
jgi:hypothetical protein